MGLFVCPAIYEIPLDEQRFGLEPFADHFSVVLRVPKQGHQGLLGMGLGMLTPVLVVILNMVWGFVAGLTIKVSK